MNKIYTYINQSARENLLFCLILVEEMSLLHPSNT